MNGDVVKGKWKQLRGEMKRLWGKLTDDELDQIEGNREKLEGLIQQRYGMSREQANDEVRSFFERHPS